jgi:hypothetical protein
MVVFAELNSLWGIHFGAFTWVHLLGWNHFGATFLSPKCSLSNRPTAFVGSRLQKRALIFSKSGIYTVYGIHNSNVYSFHLCITFQCYNYQNLLSSTGTVTQYVLATLIQLVAFTSLHRFLCIQLVWFTWFNSFGCIQLVAFNWLHSIGCIHLVAFNRFHSLWGNSRHSSFCF